MSFIDLAGRWLITSIGLLGGTAILLYISDRVITNMMVHLKFHEILFSYAVNRKKFKEWQKEQKRPHRHKMSKEEEEEYRKMNRQKDVK